MVANMGRSFQMVRPIRGLKEKFVNNVGGDGGLCTRVVKKQISAVYRRSLVDMPGAVSNQAKRRTGVLTTMFAGDRQLPPVEPRL